MSRETFFTYVTPLTEEERYDSVLCSNFIIVIIICSDKLSAMYTCQRKP